MNVCSVAHSEAALQVLFLASQANVAPSPLLSSPLLSSPLLSPPPSLPPALCHLSPAVISLISQNLSTYCACVRILARGTHTHTHTHTHGHTHLIVAYSMPKKCVAASKKKQQKKQKCRELCKPLFHPSALIIIVNVWMNAWSHFHLSLPRLSQRDVKSPFGCRCRTYVL